jgi:hypothetical protein
MTKRKPSQNYALDNEFDQTVRKYMGQKFSFTAALGKYSHFIEFGGVKEKYVTKEQSRRCFILFNKIRSDLKAGQREVILSDMEEMVKESNNRYYDNKMFLNRYYENVFLVDINSAYLYALYNLGLISDETLNYGNLLSKGERLVSVGLLAKQKEVYQITDGELVTPEPILDTSEYRFVFNAVIQEVSAIMLRAADAAGAFLFFWVDGIYFSSKDQAERAYALIENAGYKVKTKHLTGFKVMNKVSYIDVTFREEGKSKSFSLPVDNFYTEIKNGVRKIFKG